MSVAEAFVTLRPDTTGFGRETEEQVSGELSGTSSAAVGAWLGRAGKAGGAAAAAGALASLRGGLRRALDREEAIITFGRLGLDEANITQLTDEIDEALSGTVVTNPEGFALAGRFLAAGFDEADIPDIISTIADLAQVGNRSFSEMADVIVQAAGRGRVTADVINRLGDVPIGRVAEELGMTESAFREAASAGEVSAEQFLEAFAAVDEFRDAAKDETTRQALSNLGTAFSATGEAVVGPTVEAGLFREAMLELRGALDSLRPFFQRLGDVWLPLVKGALWLVTGAAKGVSTQFEAWTILVQGAIRFNRRLWRGFVRLAGILGGALAEAFGGVIMWFRRLPGRIRSAFGSARTILSGIGRSIIQGLWNGMTERWKSARSWLSGLGPIIQQVKGPLSYDREMLVPQGRAVMEGFNAGLTDGWRDVQDMLSTSTRELSQTFNGSAPSRDGRLAETVNITVGSNADLDDVQHTLRKAAISGAYG